MHWPELHPQFYVSDTELTSEERRQNVIDNPHIVVHPKTRDFYNVLVI